MTRRFLIVLLIVISSGVLPTASAEEGTDKAARILKKMDALWRGASSHGTLSMNIHTAHYSRSMKMEAWSKGKERSFVRILLPLKEKGTATLKSENNIYTYLPKTDRTIRLTSGMMMSGWMGSHFTNDDLVKQSRRFDDYHFTLTFSGERDGTRIEEITLTPKPDAAVVWGKIVLTVRTEDELPVQEAYYDEEMMLVRLLSFFDIKRFGEKTFPSRLKMTPIDKPNEYTELIYETMAFDLPIPDTFFSLATLRGNR